MQLQVTPRRLEAIGHRLKLQCGVSMNSLVVWASCYEKLGQRWEIAIDLYTNAAKSIFSKDGAMHFSLRKQRRRRR